MKKLLLLFLLLSAQIIFSQVTTYYDADGKKIGTSKVVSTPETTLDKMIKEQQNKSIDIPEEHTVEGKLKEYEKKQNTNKLKEQSETLQDRIQIIRDLGKKGCEEAKRQILFWKHTLTSQELQILQSSLPYGCYL